MLNYRKKISNESAQYLQRCIVSTIWGTVVIYYAGLGSTNIWPTMFGTCMWHQYVIDPGLSAVNDTVCMCPLSSGKVPTPSTVMTWCGPCTPKKWRVTVSPWLTTIWSGANVNYLISQAPTLLGGLNTSPSPAGSVVFGNASAGWDGIFWVQLPHATPGCMVVAPSRCTVLIQNVLLVDWLGVTVTTVFAAVDV